MTENEFMTLNAEHDANARRISEWADAESHELERIGSASEQMEKLRLIARNSVILDRLHRAFAARVRARTSAEPGKFAIEFYSAGFRFPRVLVAGTGNEAVQQAMTMEMPRIVNFVRVVQLAGTADGLEIWSERLDD